MPLSIRYEIIDYKLKIGDQVSCKGYPSPVCQIPKHSSATPTRRGRTTSASKLGGCRPITYHQWQRQLHPRHRLLHLHTVGNNKLWKDILKKVPYTVCQSDHTLTGDGARGHRSNDTASTGNCWSCWYAGCFHPWGNAPTGSFLFYFKYLLIVSGSSLRASHINSLNPLLDSQERFTWC